ncbi:MAG: D-aminoacylase [Actinobacteria bacterium]|nr:D-aminoacylase [Actinomycetota bacterium]
MEFDVILRGATVIDGTGSPASVADVGLDGGVIAVVGDLAAATAADDVDVRGRVIAPGFIDVHAHTDLSNFLGAEHDDVKLAGMRQGVTTEVCGNCGSSPFPDLHPDDEGSDPYLRAASAGSVRGYFPSLADYRAAASELALVANLAPLVGHGTLRASAMRYEDRAPRTEELVQMQRALAQALDEGAFGLSSGLMYSPGVYARSDEAVALARVLAPYDRPYTTHMRDEADRVVESVEESLDVARRAGVALQISHHKIAGRRNWGRSERTLGLIADAREAGIEVHIDVYPYTAGSTFLAALLPPWANAGGPVALLTQLRDPAVRARIARDFEFARVLRRACDRDNAALVDLVHRATGAAAAKFRLRDRGTIAPGKAADLVVFDPASVADNATYEQPWLGPTGVDHVLVGGGFVIRDGADTGRRAGRVLEPA